MKRLSIQITEEELTTLELIVDDWLHTNCDTNIDYKDAEKIHKRITTILKRK